LDDVRESLTLDSVLFVPLYMATLSYWCLVARSQVPPPTSAGRSSLVAGAMAAWLAGAFDWIENAALSRVVSAEGPTTGSTTLALSASVTKWLLAGFSVVMALRSAGRLTRGLLRRSPSGPDPRHPLTGTDAWSRAADVPGVDTHALLGVSFSGGGIRSASFSLGALQVLEETPSGDTSLFRRARWVASVSGGGYLAGARQMLAHLGVPEPFKAGSHEVDHLRRHGRYLADTPAEWVTAVARALAGLALNLAVFWLLLFVLARPVGWLHANIWSQTEIERNARPLADSALWAIVAVPAAAAVALVVLAVLARPRTDAAQPFSVGGVLWWSAGVLGVTAVAGAGIAVLVPLADEVAANLLRVGNGPARVREAAATGGVGLLTALLIFAQAKAPSRATFERWLRDGSGGDAGVDEPSGPRPARFPKLGKFLRALAGILLAALVAVLFAGLVQDAARVGMRQDSELFGVFVMADWKAVLTGVGTLLGLHLLADQTSWSLHPLYKRRLATAFALRPVSGGVAELPYDQPTALPEMARRVSDQPELVVCAAANVSGAELAPPGRRAVTFTLGPDWAGGPQIRYVRTTALCEALGPSLAGDTTLLTAMAISGAAFASAMGRHSKGTLNSILAATNLRLGVWLPSPDHAAAVAQGTARRVRTRSLAYLLREVLGRYDPGAPLLYLTDGGHYENLGLVELLRRHCRVVACFDASGGPGTLVEAVSLAYEELGVTITFPPDALDSVRSPAEARGTAAEPNVPMDPLTARTAAADVIVGSISYPEPPDGVIVYARAVLTPETPDPVRFYATDHPRFPNDPTGDQWFDADQLDNYLMLGRHAALNAVPPLLAALSTIEAPD
ncbi:MAG: hypothetical protein M3198_17260, partial [Actinomycetota bacterium]|nr:hypothetical protein [Actinomycetota bacterium]